MRPFKYIKYKYEFNTKVQKHFDIGGGRMVTIEPLAQKGPTGRWSRTLVRTGMSGIFC
jgi:hypothetical protein